MCPRSRATYCRAFFVPPLACACPPRREPVRRCAHARGESSPLFMFSEHDTDGTAFTGHARRLHCREEHAFLLLMMAPIREAFDEIGSHDEDARAEWLTGVQAPGSRFERGEHAFDDAMLISEDSRIFHGIPPASRKR